MTLLTSVADVCFIVLQYLEVPELLSLTATCRAWYDHVEDSEHWEQRFLQHFPAKLRFIATNSATAWKKEYLWAWHRRFVVDPTDKGCGVSAAGKKKKKGKSKRLMMLGLPGSGKTTMLHCMKPPASEGVLPLGSNMELLELDASITIVTGTVAGPDAMFIRGPILKSAPGIFFVVDASATGEEGKLLFDTARHELWRLIDDENLQLAPILIFANKIDVPGAKTADEVAMNLGLTESTKSIPRHWRVQASCALNGSGLMEGLAWLKATGPKKRNKIDPTE